MRSRFHVLNSLHLQPLWLLGGRWRTCYVANHITMSHVIAWDHCTSYHASTIFLFFEWISTVSGRCFQRTSRHELFSPPALGSNPSETSKKFVVCGLYLLFIAQADHFSQLSFVTFLPLVFFSWSQLSISWEAQLNWVRSLCSECCPNWRR